MGLSLWEEEALLGQPTLGGCCTGQAPASRPSSVCFWTGPSYLGLSLFPGEEGFAGVALQLPAPSICAPRKWQELHSGARGRPAPLQGPQKV